MAAEGKSSTYPLTRDLYLYTIDTASTAKQEFIVFTLSREGQEAVRKAVSSGWSAAEYSDTAFPAGKSENFTGPSCQRDKKQPQHAQEHVMKTHARALSVVLAAVIAGVRPS